MKPILLTMVTRRLSRIRGLRRPVYVIGGLVSDGRTKRDIDILVQDIRDIKILKKYLGPYSSIVHFLLPKKGPSSRIYIKIEAKPTKIKKSYSPRSKYLYGEI